jgi:transposase
MGGMKKRSHNRVVFKPYLKGQLQLPTDLELLVPEGHVVRVVDAAIEKMDRRALLRQYKGGGASSYHPEMMLKVLVYAYSQRIYSSRQIAKALRENVNFMWLSGHSQPDFRTINRFRGTVMKETVAEVFGAVLRLLVEEGYVKLEHYVLDGSKIESTANRYQWVWAKSTKKNREKLQEKVKDLLEEIERVNEAENEEYGDEDLEELGGGRPIDAEKLEKRIEELNERLRAEPQDKRVAQAVRKLEREYLPRQQKYEEQERKLAGRSSYAKTDEDATFMRMKEDHMKNGQLKPAYNIQMGTENQFVVGYSVHQRPGDTGCLVPHLEQFRQQFGRLPANVIADAGYGSDENYTYLQERGVGNFIKYPNFDREQRPRYQPGGFELSRFVYDAKRDEFRCPAGRRVLYRFSRGHTTDNGYCSQRRHYECHSCRGCRWKRDCTRAAGNRWIQVSFPLEEIKARARDNLQSEQGRILRARRCVEVESVFGRLKHNLGFRRFRLAGLEKVKVEWGLLSIAHNLTKMAV